MDMMTLPNVETTVTIDGESYVMDQTISIEANDQREIRKLSSPQGNKSRLYMASNLTTDMQVNMIIRDISADMQKKLFTCYNDEEQVDVLILDLKSGKSISVSNAFLATNPQNIKIDESENTFDIALNLSVGRGDFKTEFKDLS
jgi:hypothetical protein